MILLPDYECFFLPNVCITTWLFPFRDIAFGAVTTRIFALSLPSHHIAHITEICADTPFHTFVLLTSMWLLANAINSLASAVKSWCIRLSSSYFLGWTVRWDEPEQAFRRLLTYGLCLLVAQVESIKTCLTHTQKCCSK